MTLPPLCPRADRCAGKTVRQPHVVPSREDWAALQPEIENLYVREKRKLRHVKQYMEQVHGFRATYDPLLNRTRSYRGLADWVHFGEQMYKKRLAQWGFHKNTRRQEHPSTDAQQQPRKTSPSPAVCVTTPTFLLVTGHERMMALFLTSVRNWTTAYFENANRLDTYKERKEDFVSLPPPDTIKQSGVSFNLAIELFQRGHGALAGRVARKAFLLVEDLLALESPALVWNLIEVMHHMVTLGHVQLFRLLLTHVTGLVDRKMPMSHPLAVMLRGLRGVVANLVDTGSSPASSKSSATSPSSDGLSNVSSHDTCTEVLERAWSLNAGMVFDNFDHRLYQLYFRIHWESTHLNPPAAIIGALRRYYATKPAGAEYAPDVTSPPDGLRGNEDEAAVVEVILGVEKGRSLNYTYKLLRRAGAAAMQQQVESLLHNNDDSRIQTLILLRILAGAVKSKFLVEWPEVFDLPELRLCSASAPSRVHAGNVACAIRTLLDLNRQESCAEALDAVELTRSIVALREFAEGEAHPQVVQEMWMLEDALVAAGHRAEAREVGRDAMRRLEAYLADIPADHV